MWLHRLGWVAIAALAFAALLLLGLGAGLAQQPEAKKVQRAKEIQAELVRLRQQIVGLEAELVKLQGDTPETLYPNALKVGRVGHFAEKGGLFNFRVRTILDKNQMVVGYAATDDPVLVRGRSTAGLVDRAEIELPGLWRITGTMRVVGYGTIFVVEPIEAKKKLD